MGKRRRKGESGAATSYISRNQALKKLQLSLPDFRRLCILKGIYPHEPKSVKKVNKGSTAYKTYYYAKDIKFLAHEPLLDKFRDFKAFMRKVKRAMGKQQEHTVQRLYENRPVYTLDHLVRERYPTFLDAIRDLDDALSMLFLFATLPQHRRLQAHIVANCKRLTVELMHYIIESRALRKVFLSIKGIYYQAEIRGELVTWITPYSFSQQMPTDVDFRVMLTFVEFYATLMGFVNYRIFSSLNLKYPPQIEGLTPPGAAEELPLQVPEADSTFSQETEDFTEILSSLSQSIARVVTDDEEDQDGDDIALELTPEEEELRERAQEEERKLEQFQHLFDGCRLFLSREVPRESLAFVVRSLGGAVSWEAAVAAGGSYSEPDDGITHQVVDRAAQGHRFLSRAYVQPQWVYDCVNQRRLLPTSSYAPGATLPPHLSPFVEEADGDYVPPERARERLGETEELTSHAEEPEQVETMEVSKTELSSVGVVREGGEAGEGVTASAWQQQQQQREEKRLAVMMMSKKRKRLYEQIMKSRRKKAKEVSELKQRRHEYDHGRVKRLRLEEPQTIE